MLSNITQRYRIKISLTTDPVVVNRTICETHSYLHTYTHRCTHTHTHTHIHTRTHTHTLKHTQRHTITHCKTHVQTVTHSLWVKHMHTLTQYSNLWNIHWESLFFMQETEADIGRQKERDRRHKDQERRWKEGERRQKDWPGRQRRGRKTETERETTSLATHSGTLNHLNSLSHCGLILAHKVILVCENWAAPGIDSSTFPPNLSMWGKSYHPPFSTYCFLYFSPAIFCMSNLQFPVILTRKFLYVSLHMPYYSFLMFPVFLTYCFLYV